MDTIPNSKTIARFIQKNSPKGSHYIDADCIQIQKLYVIAWVVDKAVSKEQGYYQAIYTTYQNGVFSVPEYSIPCRYYNEGENRKITSSPFCASSETRGLISSQKSDNYTDAYITLVCSGKPMSQLFLRIEAQERIPVR